MYARWLVYKNSPKNIEEAEESLKNEKKSRKKVWDILLDYFIQEIKYEDKEENYEEWNINNCCLKDFPLTEKLDILNKYIDGIYNYDSFLDITKLIYLLWDRYMNVSYENRDKSYPHHDIYQSLYTIKTKLILMYNLSDVEFDKIRKKSYPNWHLLGIYPLLNDGEEQLKHICTKRYDDAQDMIMFSIYQYDCKKFYPTLKSIMLYWHKNENIVMHGGGSGMVGQLSLIDKKYLKEGIDIIKDSDLHELFYESECESVTYLYEQLVKYRKKE